MNADQIVEQRHQQNEQRPTKLDAKLFTLKLRYAHALSIIALAAKGPHKLSLGAGSESSPCKEGCPACAAIEFLRGYD